MSKTIADLKALRNELAERRSVEVYRIAGKFHDDQIVTAAQLQSAIEAIDAVIAEGKNQPDSGSPSIAFL